MAVHSAPWRVFPNPLWSMTVSHSQLQVRGVRQHHGVLVWNSLPAFWFILCFAQRFASSSTRPRTPITIQNSPARGPHLHLCLPSWSASSSSSGWDVDVNVDVAGARLLNVWVLFEFIEWIPGKTQEFVFGLSVLFGSVLFFSPLFFSVWFCFSLLAGPNALGA